MRQGTKAEDPENRREKKRPGSCEYCISWAVIVLLFKVACMPVTVCSHNHFTFCD